VLVAGEIVRAVVTVAEIVVAAGVLVAVVGDVVEGAVDVLVAAVAVVDAMVVTAGAEGGTKLLPRIFTDCTDKRRRIHEKGPHRLRSFFVYAKGLLLALCSLRGLRPCHPS